MYEDAEARAFSGRVQPNKPPVKAQKPRPQPKARATTPKPPRVKPARKRPSSQAKPVRMFSRSQTTVKSHRRKVKGKLFSTRVKRHGRGLNPRDASYNLARARYALRRNKTQAAVFAFSGIGELLSWVLLRGTAWAVTAIAIVFVSVGILAYNATGRD